VILPLQSLQELEVQELEQQLRFAVLGKSFLTCLITTTSGQYFVLLPGAGA
jgi:hypothetical protein